MKKIFTLVAFTFALVFSNSQVLNHQNSIYGKAERFLQLKVTDAPNDVMEIVNHTSQNNQFNPAIWVHKESSNGNVLALSAHITSAVDFGTTPLITFVAGKGIFDNNAPYNSQFPWGDGGTTLPVQNRPIFGISNAYNNYFTIAANGNTGIGTSTPLARLHNVGTVRLENLPNLTSGCLLKINSATGELGIDPRSCTKVSNYTNRPNLPIINALNVVNKIDAYEFLDDNKILKTSMNVEKTNINNNDYETVIPYLLEAIKELNTKIDELESKIISQKNIQAGTEPNIKVYPNPVKDIFNIYFEKADNSNYTIYIFDSSGKEVTRKNDTTANKKMSLNLSNLPAGVYFYEVNTTENGTVKKGKLIKE